MYNNRISADCCQFDEECVENRVRIESDEHQQVDSFVDYYDINIRVKMI